MKKGSISGSNKDKFSTNKGFKNEEENVIKVTLQGKKKSKQYVKESASSRQSSISSTKDLKSTTGKQTADENFNSSKSNNYLSKHEKKKELVKANENSKGGVKNFGYIEKNHSKSKVQKINDSVSKESLLLSGGRNMAKTEKSRSVSPFTPPKKFLDTSQTYISSIQKTNENSYQKER